jgi:hypothetical protein
MARLELSPLSPPAPELPRDRKDWSL